MEVKAKNKVVVIGAGFVGSTIAYSVMLGGFVSEIVLVDINEKKCIGEAMDMNHGLSFVKQMSIRAGSYEDLKDADVVIVTAGTNRKPGQTRLDLAKINVGILKSIIKEMNKYINENSVVIMVSNPVDVMTYTAQKYLKLPENRIFGSGTTLDTARFKYLISDHCKVDVRNVHAYIIGEHGDSEVPVWSRASIAGKQLSEFESDPSGKCPKIQCDEIMKEVIEAGGKIIALKGATYYGIALGVRRILEAVIGNENTVLTVSSAIHGKYGIEGVSLSLPCIVNRNGIESIFDIGLDDNELKLLQESAGKLKEVINEVV